jgi:aryl-alcohol dehydrogenase-like predicted oxidoreductase
VISLERTDLAVSELCLGSNIFGWTTDERETFAVIDAYVAAGGNFIDTADVYSIWVDGHQGGEAESAIGAWLAARGNRDEVVIATKVGMAPGRAGLSADNIGHAVEDSLRRLQTDYLDLYYAHADDPDVPLEETLTAFDSLVRDGKVRAIAASNYTAPRLAEALAVSRREGLAEYVAFQPHYNLLDRDGFEGELAELCAAEHLPCMPYYSLAKGYLTGKYANGGAADTQRTIDGFRGGEYAGARGEATVDALRTVAGERGTTIPAVALAWLLAQPQVVAPIASARTPAQVAELAPAMGLSLTAEELSLLDEVSRT